MDRDAIIQTLRSRLPRLMAIHAFGSRVQGTARTDSDLDLAVLVEAYADPVELWNLASDLADRVGCEIDLVDFRAASTVLQHQILTRGERWWARDWQADAYEAAVLNDKLELDAARAGLLADIQREGRVHGG